MAVSRLNKNFGDATDTSIMNNSLQLVVSSDLEPTEVHVRRSISFARHRRCRSALCSRLPVHRRLVHFR